MLALQSEGDTQEWQNSNFITSRDFEHYEPTTEHRVSISMLNFSLKPQLHRKIENLNCSQSCTCLTV